MRVDASTLKAVQLTADMPADLRQRIADALVPLHLPGGKWLFAEGDPGDAMYLVASGRLEVVRFIDGQPEVVGALHEGDTLGELALLGGGTRAAGVRAVRDSDLHALHRDDVAALLVDPRFAGAMLAAITRIARGEHVPTALTWQHRVLAVVGGDATAVSSLVDSLCASLRGQGTTVGVLRADDVEEQTGSVGAHLDRLEHAHDIVLMDGGTLDAGWSRVCARQADRVILLPGGAASRSTDAFHEEVAGCDLVLTGDVPPPVGELDRWERSVSPRAHHRLRPAHRTRDVARMARRLTGRAIGLVLSGGGARGLAHIGVLQAIEDAGIVIDRFGGTSMGAFISALAATGRTAGDIVELAGRELVDRQPFRDYTVPRHGLIRGHRAEVMLRRVFGQADVRHLPRAWFGVSADLAEATTIVHRHGPVWEAVACSMSLPGLAPPRLWSGRVVVDGGVLDNLPVGIMAADEEGPVIASDVGRQAAFGGGLVKIPGIVETLTATMGLSSRQQVEQNRRSAQVLIEPDVRAVELLDFTKIDLALSAGRLAGREALGSRALLPS